MRRRDTEMAFLLATANTPDRPVPERAHALLIAHQRRDNGGSCLCGWNKLGQSHPGHQMDMLAQAGLLAGGTKAPQ